MELSAPSWLAAINCVPGGQIIALCALAGVCAAVSTARPIASAVKGPVPFVISIPPDIVDDIAKLMREPFDPNRCAVNFYLIVGNYASPRFSSLLAPPSYPQTYACRRNI